MAECCENCAYYSELSHNFKVGEGYEKSHCCVYFVCTEKTGYVIECVPNDMCECFARRADNDAE